MMHVVKPLAIKSPDYIHDIAKDYRAMECPWLGLFCPNSVYLGPLTLINIKLMDVVESLLISVYSAKYINLTATDNSRVTIAGLRRRAIRPVDLIPVI